MTIDETAAQQEPEANAIERHIAMRYGSGTRSTAPATSDRTTPRADVGNTGHADGTACKRPRRDGTERSDGTESEHPSHADTTKARGAADETPCSTTANGRDGIPCEMDAAAYDRLPLIDRIVVPQAFAMHCTRCADDAARAGNLFRIHPSYGTGTYWYYAVDDTLAVSHFEMSFSRDLSFSCPTPPFWCFGAYNRSMIPYFGIEDDPAERVLLGYAWRQPSYTQTIDAGSGAFCVTSVLALPEGMRRIAVEFGCPPERCERTVTMLDGQVRLPALSVALDEIAHARPSERTARAFYRAKVIEAFALLLDRSDAQPAATAAQLSAADASALNLARAHLSEHLDRTVSTEELAHRAYMSASKLTRLFRRTEDMTVQEYARSLRMERACELLEGTELPLADIAAALAFTRQGSFSEAFKARFGITPREFRAMRRER